MVGQDEQSSLARARDAWFEYSWSQGQDPKFGGIFDKRLLVALDQLPGMVETETGELLPEERLPGIVEDGWIPDLHKEETGEPGFALYAPSRVGLLLQLERAGYGSAELRAIAAYEEGYIDNILVNDETPYLDDDRDLLLNEWRNRVLILEAQRERSGPEADRESLGDVEEETARTRKSIEFLENHSLESMGPALREKTARMAHAVHFFNEIIRTQLMEHLRGQVRAGYSPFLNFRRASYPSGELPKFDGIFWEGVLDSPWVEEGIPIRVPELLFEGERITLLRPVLPSEYEGIYKRYDLKRYFQLLAEQRGERRCAGCQTLLPQATHQLRQYCSPECRSRAKMRRWRDRQRPERQSLPLEDLN